MSHPPSNTPRIVSRCAVGTLVAAAVLTISLLAPRAGAQPADPPTSAAGTVELPREVYDQLVAAGQLPPVAPRKAPVGWASGTAMVTVQVLDEGDSGGNQAIVTAALQVQVLEDQWTLVPLLPLGTAVESARVVSPYEQEVTLVPAGGSLSWGVQKAGLYRISFTYRAEVRRSADGRSLAVPLPRASSVKLSGTVPGTGHDVAVIPSEGLQVSSRGGRTWFETTLPAADGVLISWRLPTSRSHTVSRADYRGRLDVSGGGTAVDWLGTYSVELFDDGAVTLPLLPSSVTLSRLEVDGSEAPILVENGRFATVVRGRGRHVVLVGFESAVAAGDGPPQIHLQIPAVPVSHFELRLPGRKEVTMLPAAAVASRFEGGVTIAVANAVLTESVSILWTEAVPDDVRAETRIDAGLYHAAWAEEGILAVEALVDLDVRRGETSTFSLRVPPEVQVDAVRAAGDGEGGDAPAAVADWRLGDPAADGSRALEIFFDRMIDRRMVVSVTYGRSLPRMHVAAANTAGDASADDGAGLVVLPLLSAPAARRQRGMAALLATRERTLQPSDDDGGASHVGENQLPAFVRQALALPVAHTFKYVDAPPRLRVRAAEPEHRIGRFDAQVDTLVSLGEVTLRAVATVDIRVKSGTVDALALTLPAGAQLLGLTGPSVRQHSLADEADESPAAPAATGATKARRIDVEFTQEMDGQFRLEASYEQILGDGEDRIAVPILGVEGAEVEQGRIAVEALSAVEVQPAKVEQLTVLDVGELPRQLVLRTTHPILHAYKYVHAESPPRLDLQATRHALESVQEAAIDEAFYATLYTRDGLAVTRARFQVRNSREQFLELRLPDDSEIWSVSVDGRSAKPARKDDDDGHRYLIQIIHSTRGFPVELVFQTRVGALRGLGTVHGVLPRPEILVTRSRWDIYLPDGIDYREPSGNMELVTSGTAVDQAKMSRTLASEADQGAESLRLEVPVRGVHFAFEKLYANQDEREVGFTIPYASGVGARLAGIGVFASTLLLWIGLALGLQSGLRGGLSKGRRALATAGLGLAGLLVLILRYQASTGPAVLVTVLLAVGGVAWLAWWMRSRRSED